MGLGNFLLYVGLKRSYNNSEVNGVLQTEICKEILVLFQDINISDNID